MVSVDESVEVGGKEICSLLQNGTRNGVPELEFFVGRSSTQGRRGSCAEKMFNEQKSSRVNVPAGAEGEWNDSRRGDGSMSVN